MPEDVAAVQRLRDRVSQLTPNQRDMLNAALRERNISSPLALNAPAPDAAESDVDRRRRRQTSVMDFSVFFFSGNGNTEAAGKYSILLDCARYADAHGFAGIWVPERHFTDFGGLYPNPSVLAAAIAMVTERMQIRAGSVVLPLHHPVRVAEEWAVVDNLSGGRVAISAAPGWHPDDFILAPGDGRQRHARRREEMFGDIDTVRRLWSGEIVELSRPDGSRQAVRTLPRPLQDTLPMWLSSQGNIDTFLAAGRLGANLLTGVLGHSMAELKEKIERYREARQAAGHDPFQGRVAAMVHTFLGTDDATVKELVRQPLIQYLTTFLAQQKGMGGGFSDLDPRDRDALLDNAFERYFDASALLGTVQRCEALVEDLVDAGVNEIACLLDFGLDHDTILAGLEQLSELKDRYARRAEGVER